MIILPPAPDEVTGHAAEMYAEEIDADGFVYAHTRAMAVNPAAHQAFTELVKAIVPSIGIRTYELATLGAASAVGSPHCLLAHGRKSLRAGILDEDQLALIAHRVEPDTLADADLAVLRFAASLSGYASSMTDADSRRLRDVGFTDRQIVDIALAAGARNLFSRVLQALAVPVDDVPGLPPRLADALSGG